MELTGLISHRSSNKINEKNKLKLCENRRNIISKYFIHKANVVKNKGPSCLTLFSKPLLNKK